jgi:formylglycine-generating enzyme required for sulfatase activity
MLRSALAVMVAALVVSWSAWAPDRSLRDQMVPVRMASDGARTIFVSPYEVTVASWQQCYLQKGCSHMPTIPVDFGSYPVTGVNWFDVNEYLTWANARSGSGLRLPTLAEWRELDRALAPPKQAPLFTDPRLAWAASYGQEKSPSGPVRPSGSFSKTPEGIFDLDGNVWEWTSTCYKSGFEGQASKMCPAFVVAGEHEATMSVFVRDPASGGCATGTPPAHLGLRLIADK